MVMIRCQMELNWYIFSWNTEASPYTVKLQCGLLFWDAEMPVMFLVWFKDDGKFLCIKERDRYMQPPLLTPRHSTLLPVISREVKHASQQRQSKLKANPQAVSFFCPLCTGNPYLMHSVFELYCFTSPFNNIAPSACHKVSRMRNSSVNISSQFS